MSKVLHQSGKCYFQIAPLSLYEPEIQQLLLLHAESLFPTCHVVPYNIRVNDSSGGSAIPDFVFISKDYEEWFVVEVEMSEHSLNSHVRPQIETFSIGTYGIHAAEHILNKRPELDSQKLLHLITQTPPNMIVIVNERPDETWYTELKRFGVLFLIFELFRADDGDEVFRIEGNDYFGNLKLVTYCDCVSFSLNYLRVASPEFLDHPPNSIIRIKYNTFVIEWKRVDSKNAVWLVPVSRNPLPMKKNARFEILREIDESLVIRIVK